MDPNILRQAKTGGFFLQNFPNRKWDYRLERLSDLGIKAQFSPFPFKPLIPVLRIDADFKGPPFVL